MSICIRWLPKTNLVTLKKRTNTIQKLFIAKLFHYRSGGWSCHSKVSFCVKSLCTMMNQYDVYVYYYKCFISLTCASYMQENHNDSLSVMIGIPKPPIRYQCKMLVDDGGRHLLSICFLHLPKILFLRIAKDIIGY